MNVLDQHFDMDSEVAGKFVTKTNQECLQDIPDL